MRKRPACSIFIVARRTALALLLAGSASISAERVRAAEEVPVLHVAERAPELASVQKMTGESEEQVGAIAARRADAIYTAVAQLTGTNEGWIAREAIGKQVPLRDPAVDSPESALDQSARGEDGRAEQEAGADDSRSEEESLEGSPSADAGELAGDAIAGADGPSENKLDAKGNKATTSGAIPLENLKPVPLMAAQTETSPEQDGETRSGSDAPVETDDALERMAAPQDTEQTQKVARRGEREPSLPVRRPAIDSDEKAEDKDTKPTSSARPPAVDLDVASEVEPSPPEQQEAPVISASVARLKRPIEQCLSYYYQRPENAAGRSAWGLMHSIMVYGVDTQVISGRKRYNAIAWLAGNNICRGKRLLAADRHGIAPRQGVGLQGHQGQLLAVLGLVGVPKNYPLYVDRQKFTVEDLIAHEQRECRSGEELTFTLIALAHYIDTDSEWRSKDGERWDFERLLQEELAQPVIGAACGGTHRLMGFSHALRIRKEKGLPITGQWARADTFIQDFTDYAWKLQNRDGSMSTNWFEGRGDNRDLDRKIQTTGHVVEWMLAHTPDDQLQDERLVRAIQFLTSAMSNNPAREKEIGPKGHALRSLTIYHQRVFGTPNPWDAGRSPRGSQTTVRRGSSVNR